MTAQEQDILIVVACTCLLSTWTNWATGEEGNKSLLRVARVINIVAWFMFGVLLVSYIA